MAEKPKLHKFDVLIIGAGGAGLRAAIGASEKGAKIAIVTKSLLGKAHTVMAEGGAAASLRNADPRDNWMVHFRDTMRGGKLHNNWKMAKIHAQQAPDRIRELERYGAVFDRTPEGRINQRNFGGHTFPRLAHVGDRTGLELIRSLQDEVIHREGVEIFMEFTITKLICRAGKIIGAFGYDRQSGELVLFQSKTVILATGGIGKTYRITSNSWEYTGDGHSLAFAIGAEIIDLEFIQFHPTGMIWPPSVKGTLVTEGVRGEGGILRNSKKERFMFNYIPEAFKGDYADTEEEAERWFAGDDKARRPPELLTRDVVARAITSEVLAGRGTPHGGAYLNIAEARDPNYIRKKLPSMYHQFKILADLDITAEAMEVGPTTHYVMGGIKVDGETQETNIEGLYACGEAGSGLHGANRLGGNSLTDLLVFGKISGEKAAEAANNKKFVEITKAEIDEAMKDCLAPFQKSASENPYALHEELQEIMETHAGIKRSKKGLEEGLKKLFELDKRVKKSKATGSNRIYNTSWHQALDIKNMVATSIIATAAALERKESRGAHTREDYPETDDKIENILYVFTKGEEKFYKIIEESYPEMNKNLMELVATESREELIRISKKLMDKGVN